MTAPELKPCPFCGGEASISKDHDQDGSGAFYAVKCHKCRAKSSEIYAVETCNIHFTQVRDAWNRRADLAAVQHAQVMIDDQERNYLHLHNAAYDVWRWFETARPDLIGLRAERLRDAVMGPRPYGNIEPQPTPPPQPRPAASPHPPRRGDCASGGGAGNDAINLPIQPTVLGWQEQVEAHKAAKAALAAAKEMQHD